MALVLLGGCADLNDTGLRVLSDKVAAFAIVDDQLLQGEMLLFPDRTGTVALRFDPPPTTESLAQPIERPAGGARLTSCVGRMRRTSANTASLDLRCNDGAEAELRVALIGGTRGYGYGHTASGLASLTFGMNPTEARAHLTVPLRRQLMDGNDSSRLELQ